MQILYTPKNNKPLAIQYTFKHTFRLNPGFNTIDDSQWEEVNKVVDLKPSIASQEIVINPSAPEPQKMSATELLKERARKSKEVSKKPLDTQKETEQKE